jgi:Domain of unknown function (DUF4845)
MSKLQSGMSSIGLLLVLLAAAFGLMVVFKVGPLYLDNYFVKSSVDALIDEDVRKMSNNQIADALDRYFLINGVRDISARTAAKIEREDTRTVVKVDYEKRVNFLANLDVVVTFENHYDSSQSQ